MRRSLGVVVLGMVLGAWSARAGATAIVSIGSAVGLPGQGVDISFRLSDTEGLPVAAVQLDVLYPDTILNVDLADDCNLAARLPESLSLIVFQVAPDRARFLVIDLGYPGALISDGELFTCTFHIAPEPAATVAELVGDRLEVSDDLAMPIPASVENGAVTVVLCGNGTVDPGENCDDAGDNGSSRSCCAYDCQYVPNGAASCDGNDCTRPDTCTDGVCTPGVCADGQGCTICGGVCVDAGSMCLCE